jgi:hypothetical protein
MTPRRAQPVSSPPDQAADQHRHQGGGTGHHAAVTTAPTTTSPKEVRKCPHRPSHAASPTRVKARRSYRVIPDPSPWETVGTRWLLLFALLAANRSRPPHMAPSASRRSVADHPEGM